MGSRCRGRALILANFNLSMTTSDPMWPVLSPFKVGAACKCPRCGVGALYREVLRVNESCPHCGLALPGNETGDGAAVFVIFILGFVLIPLVFWFEVSAAPAVWVHLLLWPPIIGFLAMVLLRPVKGILVALHFRNIQQSDER